MFKRNTVGLRCIVLSPMKCVMLCLEVGVGVRLFISFIIMYGHVSSNNVSMVVGLWNSEGFRIVWILYFGKC